MSIVCGSLVTVGLDKGQLLAKRGMGQLTGDEREGPYRGPVAHARNQLPNERRKLAKDGVALVVGPRITVSR